MSNYAILRLEKRSLGQAQAMARHALRDGSVQNADPSRRGDNKVLVGRSSADQVMAELRAKLPVRRRRDAVLCIELFIGSSPEAMQRMPPQAQDSYFASALKWAGARFGGATNIVSAVVHRDEQTPHMQVLLVPLLDGKLNAKELVGNKGDMVKMQTDFAEQVGKQFQLRRGERGSPAKHTSIRQFYAAMHATGRTDALPPRVPVPEALPEPGVFALRATREAYEAREQQRKEAMAANRNRQAQIELLARVGLAVKGRKARVVPEKLSAAEAKLASLTKRIGELDGQCKEIEDRIRGKCALMQDLQGQAAPLQAVIQRERLEISRLQNLRRDAEAAVAKARPSGQGPSAPRPRDQPG
jgi:hypothetical protein